MNLFHKYFEELLHGGPCVWCNEHYSFFLIQFLKVTTHLQLLQDIGSIPHIVQYIPVAYFIPKSLYLPMLWKRTFYDDGNHHVFYVCCPERSH